MFDFERLDVYQKAKAVNRSVYRYIKQNPHLDYYLKDQLGRASMSIRLNIAEGAGRFGKKDKKNFYVISRSSAFEVASVLEFLEEEGEIGQKQYLDLYEKLEEISKILYKMIRNLDS